MRTAWARLRGSLDATPPEQIALLLSVGLVLGVFPIMGVPTLLCVAAAVALRLNVAALGLLNSIATPLQLALLLPLARVGTLICGDRAFAAGSWTGKLGSAALHAIAGWACVCIPLGAVLYAGLTLLLRRGVARAGIPAGNTQLLRLQP